MRGEGAYVIIRWDPARFPSGVAAVRDAQHTLSDKGSSELNEPPAFDIRRSPVASGLYFLTETD